MKALSYITRFILIPGLLWGMAISFVLGQVRSPLPPYKNAALPIEKRVNDLLGRMTLDEKIGQMTQLCASSITLDGSKKLDLNTDKIRDLILKYHIGSFLSGTGKAERWVNFIGAIQAVAIKETRLGIPVIYGMDNVHGSDYVDEATMLPHNLTLSCSFNPELAASAAKITALESADLGHIWNFAPVLDVGKNPYWPRLYETFGEDPYLCGLFGATYIKAFENCPEIAPYKLAACAKHFIGYSDPKSGWDRTPSEIPDQVLHEFFTPSFKAAFAAGVKTLMVNSGELNGEPVHGSRKILTELLRNQLKFKGVVLTDIKDILKIVEMHGGAATEKEATLLAINAGIDMSMACSEVNFCRYMRELAEEKKLSEDRINESVKRILQLKFELGLFENPYPNNKHLSRVGAEDNLKAAQKAAEESVVLLKNKNSILPLNATGGSILVAGFAANSKRNINGAWTLEWLGAPENRQPKNMETLFSALQKQFPNRKVELADSNAENPQSVSRPLFISQANQAEVIVLTLGEIPYSEFKGNINDLQLDANHASLLNAALETGKPVVVIYFGGRPRIITKYAESCAAIIFAGSPGQEGAKAIASILSGGVNPSGRLSFTWPREVGHCVPYYFKKSEKYNPLFPFGHGLSYTEFTYSDLKLADTLIKQGQSKIKATIQVKNNGKLAGKEPVLWFIKDDVGRITRPDKLLKKVVKIGLAAGESKTLTFEIDVHNHLSYPDAQGKAVLEPGTFQVLVGDKKAGFRLLE